MSGGERVVNYGGGGCRGQAKVFLAPLWLCVCLLSSSLKLPTGVSAGVTPPSAPRRQQKEIVHIVLTISVN